jgi:hypothetical protein
VLHLPLGLTFGTLAEAEPYVPEADGAVLDANLAGEMVWRNS